MIGEYLAMTVYDAMFSRWCQIDVAALATLNRRFTSGACLHKPTGRSMLSAGRKPSAEATRLVRLTLSSTFVPSSACFRANAICSSVNLLVFMAWPSCPRGHIMPNFSTFAPDYFLGQGQSCKTPQRLDGCPTFGVQFKKPPFLRAHMFVMRRSGRATSRNISAATSRSARPFAPACTLPTRLCNDSL